MKHIIETDKPISIRKESKIIKANEYSYKTTIPKEVMETFPQLKEQGKVIFNIHQVDVTHFECDITLHAKGMTITDDKLSKETKTNDMIKDVKESQETKTDDAKKVDAEKYPIYENENLVDDKGIKYHIRYKNSKSSPKIQIMRTHDNKQYKLLGITYINDDEIQEIIDKLIKAKSLKKAENILDKYRPRKKQR